MVSDEVVEKVNVLTWNIIIKNPVSKELNENAQSIILAIETAIITPRVWATHQASGNIFYAVCPVFVLSIDYYLQFFDMKHQRYIIS